jgi:hypothetical protein
MRLVSGQVSSQLKLVRLPHENISTEISILFDYQWPRLVSALALLLGPLGLKTIDIHMKKEGFLRTYQYFPRNINNP